jgi:hypothetical protein
MQKNLLIMLAVLLGALLFAGCSGSGVSGIDGAANDQGDLVIKPDGDTRGFSSLFEDPTPADPVWRWCMMFGQEYRWGGAKLVSETDADGNVWWYMKYWLTDEALEAGWMFCDAHVDVSDEPYGEKDGKPGKFAYKWDSEGDYDAMVEWNVDCMLALGDWAPADGGDYIAIHATICKGHWEIADDGTEYWVEDANETGWGGYCSKYDEAAQWDGSWKKWGGWVYTASGNGLPIFEPVYDKCYGAGHYGAESYWDIRFKTEDWYPEEWIGGNDWPGWCTDPQGIYSGFNRSWCVDIFSCYDEETLADYPYAQSDNWEFISYMINMRNKGEAPYNKNWSNNYWKDRFQDAVWYFKRGTVNYNPGNSDAWIFINDAITNGDNYVPGPGEFYAVILWPGLGGGMYGQYPTSFQMNIIEVDP